MAAQALIGNPALGIVEHPWRDDGGQDFAGETDLATAASKAGLSLTPRLFTVDVADVPAGVEGMHAFLGKELPGMLVALDETGHGAAEGIVLRTTDRSVIAKARLQDYQRTLKRRAGRR